LEPRRTHSPHPTWESILHIYGRRSGAPESFANVLPQAGIIIGSLQAAEEIRNLLFIWLAGDIGIVDREIRPGKNRINSAPYKNARNNTEQ
jgi:hypothetical protein